MSAVLTFLALILASVPFVYPLGEPFVRPLETAVLAFLALALVAQLASSARRRKDAAKKVPAPKPEVAPPLEAAVQAGVVQFLARLQEKGRLVDFVMDDVAPYSNEQIGAAARVVHQGCREALQEFFEIQPVHPGEEQEPVSLSGEYDAASYRLVGNVPDNPPYRGRVLHRGWKTARVRLPRVTEASRKASAREIIAPAEVEIG